MDTRLKILETAREQFNSHGLKRVTARAICSEMKISPGSFSYHFPDKSVIIKTLYENMQLENWEILATLSGAEPTIFLYLETHRKLFQIQKKYKFFFLNLFEILNNYTDIKSIFLENLQKERLMAKGMMAFYVEQGILKKEIDEQKMERLINVGQVLNNFWAVDAEIMPKKNDKQELIHYMKICCGLLEPWLEIDSLNEYNAYFAALEKEVK